MVEHTDEQIHEIKEHYATLYSNDKGWTKEFNLVSWGGAEPKYDIRNWGPGKEKMRRGVTFTKEELSILKKALNEMTDV